MRILLIVLALIAAVLLGVAAGFFYLLWKPRPEVSPSAYPWLERSPGQDMDVLAEQLLGRMTLDEKLAEMTGEGVWVTVATSLWSGHFAVIHAGGNPRLGIPPVAFTDGPRGITTAPATAFPVALARAASWDVELERRVGDAMGIEARAAGANYLGGLCINLLRHPSWGRAQESYGEDPWLTGELAVSYLQAAQRHNVMVSAKHFALNSIEFSRYHVDVQVDERTLREVYLPHFKKCVDHGVASLMSAYNKVRGEFCGHNRYLLTEILRNEWGFRGFVSSDWEHGLRDTTAGVRAGLNLEMATARHYGKRLSELIRSGAIAEDEIDPLVLDLLRTKLRFVSRPDPIDYSKSRLASHEHVTLAREVAEQSMVLLKNQPAVLPFERESVSRLAVVGRLAGADNTGDRGSSKVKPPHLVPPLQGLQEYLGANRVSHASGTDLEEVRRVAREADAAIVVVGIAHDEEGEYISIQGKSARPGQRPRPILGLGPGGDRYPLSLTHQDLAVIRAAAAENTRTVVVLIGGSAITMEEWRQQVPSILMAWYGGMEGGRALARLLFGELSPSGKLPLTIPLSLDQLPSFDPYADSVTYGYYHGYTLLDKVGLQPAFPFGYGLSYTDFRFESLEVMTPEIPAEGRLRVGVEVTNTGNRQGSEVVQLYVGFPNSSVDRPVKLLRAFQKVLLAPGETRRVVLEVPARELAYYDPRERAWKVEAVEHRVLAGPSSRREDLREAAFRVVD